MTPIKVGALTVSRIDWKPGLSWPSRVRFVVTDSRLCEYRTVGTPDGFRTLPMALRFAAEMAGIERQRVELVDFEVIRAAGFSGPPLWHTYNGPDDVDPDTSGALPKLMDRAHEYARDRYAAHGGAS
jgi:hypothetical protein